MNWQNRRTTLGRFSQDGAEPMASKGELLSDNTGDTVRDICYSLTLTKNVVAFL